MVLRRNLVNMKLVGKDNPQTISSRTRRNLIVIGTFIIVVLVPTTITDNYMMNSYVIVGIAV